MANELKKPEVVIRAKGKVPGKMETDADKKQRRQPEEITLAKGRRELIKEKHLKESKKHVAE